MRDYNSNYVDPKVLHISFFDTVASSYFTWSRMQERVDIFEANRSIERNNVQRKALIWLRHDTRGFRKMLQNRRHGWTVMDLGCVVTS